MSLKPFDLGIFLLCFHKCPYPVQFLMPWLEIIKVEVVTIDMSSIGVKF